MLSRFQPLEPESIPLADCGTRVLAEDIQSAIDLPLFDNSTMDGFALRSADTSGASSDPVALQVVGDIQAGANPHIRIGLGEAARIMTGAPLPAGADAVIPSEDTDFHERGMGAPPPERVKVSRVVRAGEFIRTRGMDVRRGMPVLKKGVRLKPQAIGLLAMLGIANVRVHRQPRIALISSGDELLEVDAPLESGKIRDSNSYTLAALIQDAGGQVLRLGVARDNRRSLESLFEKSLHEKADLILSSAGVSVGAFDFVRAVLESNDKMDFWRVNMRPGKPLAFGEYRNIPFIGLPGNPVSAFVGFEVFVRPVIARLSGLADEPRPRVRVISSEQIESDGRESYLRAVIREENGSLHAKLTGHQGSGNLLSLVMANALLIIPAGVKCVPAGQEVEAWLL